MSAHVVFCGEVLNANLTEPTLEAFPESARSIRTVLSVDTDMIAGEGGRPPVHRSDAVQEVRPN
jgi:hypothetical protein